MSYKLNTFHNSSFRIYSPLSHSLLRLILKCFLLVSFVLYGCTGTGSMETSDTNDSNDLKKIWVGTWSTAPQLVEPRNMPPAPGLSNNTLRQVVRVSLGGDSLQVRFSNEFSTSPVTIKAVQIAVSQGGSSIDTSTIKGLKFNGKPEVTMNPGTAIISDPFLYNLEPRMDLAITIYFGETSPDVTGHPGSRTTSYLLSGSNISAIDFKEAAKAERWYIISGIDVKAPESATAVVVLGNSITDGRGSGINKQDRWPDILAERLLANPGTQQVAVLNQGIGGNCVLRSCLGPSGLDRFDRDVIKQHGIHWLIILEGINDIGQTHDSTEASKVAGDLISAYKLMIEKAHAEGILVYGATLTPIGNSFYYTDYHENARNIVNKWIRNSGSFNAVIDFDKVLRNPEDSLSILPSAHSGDFLHPNESGYKMMGEAIELKLFE